MGSKRAMRRLANDVKDKIMNDNGTDTPILDKLQAVVDWIIANQDKIMQIVAFIMKFLPLLML